MRTHDHARRRFLLAVFVVSGFTGLIYESIWSQYLKLFLGHAAYAQSLVLAIFMGGMALGSWLVARWTARIQRLLWVYVLVEAAIGLCGVAFHPAFVAAYDFSFGTVIPALPSAFWIHVYKWTLGAAAIFPQSVLLGMTFPLISAGLIRRWPERPGETLATLYFTNSLGAAAGVLVGGFVLIGAVGLPGTVRIAGVLNLVLALTVWSAVRGAGEPAQASRSLAPGDPFAGDALSRWLPIAAFLTGTAAFMYELGWIRMLSLVLGSSTHSFELMLSAFILGLAFGGLYVKHRIERLADPASTIACVLLAMGTLAALTLPAYQATFDVMAWFLRTHPRTAGGYVEFNLLSQLIAALVMIPATFCAGMTLPLMTRELMRRGAGERAIGAIYSANTVGAIAGVLLTVHWVMPRLGLEGVILGGAAIQVALGLSRLSIGGPTPARSLRIAGALALGLLAAVAFTVRLDPQRMTSGVYRTASATLPAGAVVRYLEDGETATISLVEKDGTVTIATNGKPDAGLQMDLGEPTVDESTMVLAAAVPLSMLAHPARVANIGFGSGLTTHTLLASPRVARLDSIEIEPFVVDAARLGFGARIHDVFEDPRSHIVFEDAKTFFASSREPYDLIVSEPSNPWVSGVATLFSTEFYARVTHYLTPDGYFVQWLQVYETDLGILASVIKALAPHFGAYALYDTNDLDVLIVATKAPSLGVPGDRLLESPALRAALERIGVRSAADLQARKIGDDRTLGPALEALPVPANSDFHPYVDLNAPRLRYLRANAMALPALTVLPIPFLELVGVGPVSRAPTPPFAPGSEVIRDRLAQRALDIRMALTSGDFAGLDPDTARSVEEAGSRDYSCDTAPARDEWQQAVRSLSDATAPYLTPAELETVWSRIESTPCHREAAGSYRAWLELWAALARRDTAAMAAAGTRLIAPQAGATPADLAYVVTAVAAADVNRGERARAHALLEAQWGRLEQGGRFDLALRELRAMTARPVR